MKKNKELKFFDRYLSIWVLCCMAIGILFSKYFPDFFHMLGKLEIAQVNLPVGILIWIMIIPMLIRIDLGEIRHVKRYWRGSLITLFVNWLVKPFSMALLGWLFLKCFFAKWLSHAEIDHYIAGLIILAAAPCTAMVFVWSYLCDVEPHFTLTQVALNDLIMVVAFAPIVGLLLGITHLTVAWSTVAISVLMYILTPLILAQAIRYFILHYGHTTKLSQLLNLLHPFTIGALLGMLILLFGFQGDQILKHPSVVVLIAIPIIIQVYFNSMLVYGLSRVSKEQHVIAGPGALIGASNFFELAVATAISVFGLSSGATLATVVGVLIEVPVMLSIVKIINKSKNWYNCVKS